MASAAQASLLRQQEELDRKAAELERKERELQNMVANLHARENNWLPLAVWCPVKPCFYQDFSTEIPADYQRICKMLYYLWMRESCSCPFELRVKWAVTRACWLCSGCSSWQAAAAFWAGLGWAGLRDAFCPHNWSSTVCSLSWEPIPKGQSRPHIR